MKILIFDDSKINRVSAELTLKDHTITVVGTYDEAQAALTSKRDYEKARSMLPGFLEESGLSRDFNPWQENSNVSESDKVKYRAASKKADELATTHPDFDVVLTDLLVPASRQAQGPNGARFVGQELPLGTTIALLALCAGIKNVAVATDMNHHDHPASAAFDCFRGRGGPGGVNILCTNHVGMVAVDETTGELVSYEFLESAEGKQKYPYPEGETWGKRKGLASGGKNWKAVLQVLLGEVEGR